VSLKYGSVPYSKSVLTVSSMSDFPKRLGLEINSLQPLLMSRFISRVLSMYMEPESLMFLKLWP